MRLAHKKPAVQAQIDLMIVLIRRHKAPLEQQSEHENQHRGNDAGKHRGTNAEKRLRAERSTLFF